MTEQVHSITFPVGRLISGNVTEAQTKDYQGQPLVDKQGQPAHEFFIMVAIPKTPGVDWVAEKWGTTMYQVAAAGVPNSFDPATRMPFVGRPFAWKVIDGDSQVPNSVNKKPCDQPNYPGNWIVSFKSKFAPKMCDALGTTYLTDPQSIKRGYYVQVVASCNANNDSRNPGIFLNQQLVALAAYGEEIVGGVDMTKAGLGVGTTLPPGASATPVGGMAEQTTAPPPQTPPAAGAPPAVHPEAVQPATDMVTPPPPVAPPVAPAAVPMYEVQGQRFTAEQLLAMPGWNQAIIDTLTPVA